MATSTDLDLLQKVLEIIYNIDISILNRYINIVKKMNQTEADLKKLNGSSPSSKLGCNLGEIRILKNEIKKGINSKEFLESQKSLNKKMEQLDQIFCKEVLAETKVYAIKVAERNSKDINEMIIITKISSILRTVMSYTFTLGSSSSLRELEEFRDHIVYIKEQKNN